MEQRRPACCSGARVRRPRARARARRRPSPRGWRSPSAASSTPACASLPREAPAARPSSQCGRGAARTTPTWPRRPSTASRRSATAASPSAAAGSCGATAGLAGRSRTASGSLARAPLRGALPEPPCRRACTSTATRSASEERREGRLAAACGTTLQSPSWSRRRCRATRSPTRPTATERSERAHPRRSPRSWARRTRVRPPVGTQVRDATDADGGRSNRL
mmetsp:Transcript_11467/g.33113  ORF Transcript_11467/g.33113 Transcript_11467/m.33113 type:complete len:221 (-) Transcript_11467:85-747(-)